MSWPKHVQAQLTLKIQGSGLGIFKFFQVRKPGSHFHCKLRTEFGPARTVSIKPELKFWRTDSSLVCMSRINETTIRNLFQPNVIEQFTILVSTNFINLVCMSVTSYVKRTIIGIIKSVYKICDNTNKKPKPVCVHYDLCEVGITRDTPAPVGKLFHCWDYSFNLGVKLDSIITIEIEVPSKRSLGASKWE